MTMEDSFEYLETLLCVCKLLPSGLSNVLLARILAISTVHACWGSITSSSSNSLWVLVFFSVSLVGDDRDPSVSRDERRARS